MSTQPSADRETIEQTKQQIRDLVSEIAQLTKRDLSPEEFYGEFLQRIVSALAAVGGAVWTLAEGGRLELAYQINLRQTAIAEAEGDLARHTRLLGRVIQKDEGMLVPPHSGGGDGQQEVDNPTRLLLVLAPLRGEGQVEGVVEVFQRPDTRPSTQRGYLSFLSQMCELAGKWLKSRKLRQFSTQQSLWAQAEDFSRLVHESLDPRLTAYTIANEGRRLIGCDRVSVAINKGRRCVIEAVSGQDTFDRRSNTVTLLGRLATRVVATGEPLWHSGSTDDLPPQVEEAVEEYVDESFTKSIAVLPLTKPSEPSEPGEHAESQQADDRQSGEVIGAIIVEQMENVMARETLQPRIDIVYDHSARALGNALQYNNLFLMPLWRLLGRATWVLRAKTLPKTVAVAAAVVAVVVGLCVVPADFEMKARGTLQPARTSFVFADLDGNVADVQVQHGDFVEKGQPLAVLDSRDLDMQLTTAQGELDAAMEELARLEKYQLRGVEPGGTSNSGSPGEIAPLEKRIASYRKQLDLLKSEQQRLTITSPIDGQVVTWKLDELLTDRWVGKGQRLFTIADPKGPWELELYVPEDRMGHVEKARQKQAEGEALSVTYIVATDPRVTHEGKVREIHWSARPHEEHGHSVRIRVEIDKQDIISQQDPAGLRPGAMVTAKIYCGRRSIGYVWLHELFEFVQSRVLF